MGVFTIFLKQSAADTLSAHRALPSLDALTDAKILREGFSWPAFIFGPFWLLWHRLWLGLVAYIGIIAVFGGVSSLLSFGSFNWLVFLTHMLLGFEAERLREAKFSRTGFQLVDIVAANGMDEAARRFFHRLAGGNGGAVERPQAPPTQLQPAYTARTEPDVLGLFSNPEA